jgi:hypothetical protein
MVLMSGDSFHEEAVTLASYMDEKHNKVKKAKAKDPKAIGQKSPQTIFKISQLFKGNSINSDLRAMAATQNTILMKIPYKSWFKLKREL